MIENSDRIFIVNHTVVNQDGKLIDITPFADSRERNVFIKGNDQTNYTSYIIERGPDRVVSIRDNNELFEYMLSLKTIT